MTISNTNRTAGPFSGNGVTREFSFSFKVFARSDLLVAVTNSAGIESILLLDADYIVNLNVDQNNSPGGIIRTSTPVATGSTLSATSNLPILQALDLTNNGGFYPEAINRALDRIVINVQQLSAKIGLGALNVGVAATISSVLATLSNLASSAGAKTIGFMQTYSGAVLRTIQAKFGDDLTNLDFISMLEAVKVVAGTSTADLTDQAQIAINAAGSRRKLRWIGTTTTRALASSDSVHWIFDAGASIKQLPIVYAAGSFHISLTGPNIVLENLYLNGNQWGMASGQGSNGLLMSGPNPRASGRVDNYNGRGYDCNSVNTPQGPYSVLNISCSGNAGLGFMTTAASYLDIGGVLNGNGLGFQKTRANSADQSHSFIAFGCAIRMRSHHIILRLQAMHNGRDGININQGSYAIKHIGCLAYDNDDGGFTIAADNTGTGLVGEGEGCYDITYDSSCEAYNNWGSGLAVYQSANNISFFGRSYNNHRLAGDQPYATSYPCGIYFAAGTSGIDVDAKLYDDRQSRVIAAVAGGVITATGWVPGAMLFYPKVAIYSGADGSFRGYGKITAEAAGSVTITPTSFQGIVLGSVVNGDYITQAVQHNGAFADSNCQGYIDVDGAGHRPNHLGGLSGYNVYSSGFTQGQNILTPKERHSSPELLLNPSFDADTTGWTYDLPGGAVQSYYTGAPKRSRGALRIIAGTSGVAADASLVPGAIDALGNQFCEYAFWCSAFSRDDAYIQLFWTFAGSTFNTTVAHPGGGGRTMKIGAMIPNGSSSVVARIGVRPGKTVYFDEGTLKAVATHMDPREFTFPSRSLPV